MTVDELTERSPEPAARERAERIRAGIHNYLETLAEIALAWERRDWQVLEYADWQAYVDGEFGAERLRLPVEHRQRAVAELRLAGMSQRAIGTVLGVDAATVNRDLRGVADATPAEVRGADGKTYAAARPAPANPPPGRGPELDEQVWIAAARKAIEAHALKTKTSTRCSRSTRAGLTLPARQAAERHAATWCRKCWPEQPAMPSPPLETAAGVTTEPADGADTACPHGAGDAAPAPAPPSAHPGGGAGVTPCCADPMVSDVWHCWGCGNHWSGTSSYPYLAVDDPAAPRPPCPACGRPGSPESTSRAARPAIAAMDLIPTETAAGVEFPSADGAAETDGDTRSVAVTEPAPAPALPAASPAGGAGVTPELDRPGWCCGSTTLDGVWHCHGCGNHWTRTSTGPGASTCPQCGMAAAWRSGPVSGRSAGDLTLTQIARLRAVFEWARAGLAGHPRDHQGRGKPSTLGMEYAPGEPTPPLPLDGRSGQLLAHVQVSWDDGALWVVWRSDKYVLTNAELPPVDVDQAIDLLCALGIVPARFSRQYAAGVQAGLRRGAAIDGELVDER